MTIKELEQELLKLSNPLVIGGNEWDKMSGRVGMTALKYA